LRIKVGLVVKPEIKGFLASARIESRSAPSAKILTRSADKLSGDTE
jgi:hypothetical protein